MDDIEVMARELYAIDREKWIAAHPEDSFIEWDDCSLEAFKDQWRAKAKRLGAALEAEGWVVVDQSALDAAYARGEADMQKRAAEVALEEVDEVRGSAFQCRLIAAAILKLEKTDV